MKFKNILLFFLIICLLGIFKSFSYFTFKNSVQDNTLNIGSFPKARVRIYQVTMPLVHEYDEDDYIEIFKKIAISEIVPGINNPTSIDKIDVSEKLKFNLRKDIKFYLNDKFRGEILHHIIVISNASPFNDGRDKINFSKEKLGCELYNVYFGETTKQYYSVNFARTSSHRNPINLKETEKYILTFDWNKDEKKYRVNKKNDKNYYNADLILFDITSFIIDDQNTIDELIERMEIEGDSALRLHSTTIDISFKLTTDRFKINNSQILQLLRE